MVNHWLLHFFGSRLLSDLVIAFDQSALFADLDLDRAGLARGIGLLDLAGGLLDQGDLFAVARLSTVAGLKIAEQFLLVIV